MDRRDFIKTASFASLPLFLPKMVFGQSQTGRDILINVFQRGGADGLNMVVPYFDSNYYSKRPNLSIAPPGTAGGALDLDGGFWSASAAGATVTDLSEW